MLSLLMSDLVFHPLLLAGLAACLLYLRKILKLQQEAA